MATEEVAEAPTPSTNDRRRAAWGCGAAWLLVALVAFALFQVLPAELTKLETINPGPLARLDPTQEPVADEVNLPPGFLDQIGQVTNQPRPTHASLEAAQRTARIRATFVVLVVGELQFLNDPAGEGWRAAVAGEAELMIAERAPERVRLTQEPPCVLFLAENNRRLAADLCGADLSGEAVLDHLDAALQAHRETPKPAGGAEGQPE